MQYIKKDLSCKDLSCKNSYPFSYFLGNKEIINNLKLELLRLKGQRYICKDEHLAYIDKEIANVERNLKFNNNL